MKHCEPRVTGYEIKVRVMLRRVHSSGISRVIGEIFFFYCFSTVRCRIRTAMKSRDYES